ncbi:MAG: 50S ribosomal protein L25 [Desulfobacteraceae bacterium]|nr:50S ribosomal protein L25 [Desulfobacteraceae bacterium]
MELIDLKAQLRKTKGKSAAKALRKSNAIPAIMYGAKTEAVLLSINTSEFDKIIRENGSTGLFFNVNVDNGALEKSVMLKELQMDTFGLQYQHIDLHAIDMDSEVTVTVPIEAVGVSSGVKEGGLLQIIRRELDVLCKPVNTPDVIKIDITELEIGNSIHVDEIDLGENVQIPHEVNFTVLTIVAPTVEEEVEEEELLEEGAEEDAEEAAEEGAESTED